MDQNKHTYRAVYGDEFLIANDVLKCEPGALYWSEHDYEAFRFESEEVTLIFYPHKVKGTGNYHIRVRDQHSKNPIEAHRLILALDKAAGLNCTFRTKNWSSYEEKYKTRGKK